MLHPDIYEKLVQAHYQELLHEAEQQHMLAQLPRRHPQLLQNVARRFTAFFTNLFVKKVERLERAITRPL
jgi:DNA-binding transcriptional regulator YbjK